MLCRKLIFTIDVSVVNKYVRWFYCKKMYIFDLVVVSVIRTRSKDGNEKKKKVDFNVKWSKLVRRLDWVAF